MTLELRHWTHSIVTDLSCMQEATLQAAEEGATLQVVEPIPTIPLLPRAPKPLHHGKTIFCLPGELRNTIYGLVLDINREHVPYRPGPENRVDGAFTLLQTSTQVWYEARGLLANLTTAYIPVIEENCGPLKEMRDNRVNTNTISRAIQEFMNVHFHLHTAAQYQIEFDPNLLLQELYRVIKEYMAYSQEASKKHQWRRRHAVVHLDHFVSVWSVWSNHYEIGTYHDLIKFLASDINTIWEIRYYVPTDSECYFKNADFAILQGHCRKYELVTVKAEVYGEKKWDLEGTSKYVTRDIMACTKVWPNLDERIPPVLGCGE